MMVQVVDDVDGNASPVPPTKAAWTAPVIETYDVAEFTLGVHGLRGYDAGGANIS